MHFLVSKTSGTLLILLFAKCALIENDCVDFNDILSPNWMPGTLLENVGSNSRTHVSNKSINNEGRVLDGSIGNALDTMIFHRSMINQYLCRSYVANQILSEMTQNSFKRRTGDLDLDNSENRLTHQRQKLTPTVLLDQGSSSYEDWLLKSATLGDIYRHHNKINSLKDTDVHSSKIDVDEMDKSASISTKFDHDYHGAPEMPDYPIYNGHHHGHEPPAYFHPTSYHTPHIKKTEKKGEKIADIFEIALTALAYLSFGMFIIHLIMSITAVSSNVASTISSRIVAVNIGPSAAINADRDELDNIVTESTIESEEYKYRSNKEPVRLTDIDNITINKLAKRMLSIFDSALNAQEDNGQCLQNSLCNASKYSRFINGKSKLFLGLWSFGVSWLSEIISNKIISKTESLQAVIFGLGIANCENIYKKCQQK